MTGFRRLSKIRHKKSRTAAFVAAIAVVLSGVILPLSDNASALRADSISKIQGSTKGGDEVIIKGNGFLKEEKDEIWRVYHENKGYCDEWDTSSSCRAIVLAKSGNLYLQDLRDNSNKGISQEMNIPKIIDIVNVRGDDWLITESREIYRTWLDIYDGHNWISNEPIIKIEQPFSPYDIKFISKAGNNSDVQMIITKDDKVYKLTNYRTYAYEMVDDFLQGESIKDFLLGDVIETSGGRLLKYVRVNNNDRMQLHDLTQLIGDEKVVAYNVGNEHRLVLESGRYINFRYNASGGYIQQDNSLVNLLQGRKLVSRYGPDWEGYYTTDNEEFISVNKIYGRDMEIVSINDMFNIPKVSKIDYISTSSGTLHRVLAEDGIIYGVGWSSYSNTTPKLVDITGLNGYNLDSIWYHQGNSLIFNSQDSKVILYVDWQYNSGSLSISEIGGEYILGSPIVEIETNANRAIVVTENGQVFNMLYDGDDRDWGISRDPSYAEGLPLRIIHRVYKLFFGEVESTDFEILDNNTIRVIIPANAKGIYSISIQSVDSSLLVATNLSYEYISGSGGGSSTVEAPNTGFKR